ncbi:hypothetical protein MK079_05275 [Candidatus Gracilibacteria bacterium]|nr:hypothetical protein [Candidatus Gracilibacteria bacterium]
MYLIRRKNRSMVFFRYICVGLLLGIFSSQAFSNTCEYQSEIDECLATDTPRAITDYVCSEGSYEEKVYQIVLDKKFQELDKEVETYIFELERDKDRYFGKNRDYHHMDGILEVFDLFSSNGYYGKKYKQMCGEEVVKEAIVCMGGTSPVDTSLDFFRESTCQDLVDFKMNVYERVAYDVLLMNKGQVRKDESKLYVTDERTKYDALIDLFSVNLSYIERIWKKWPSKIYNVH